MAFPDEPLSLALEADFAAYAPHVRRIAEYTGMGETAGRSWRSNPKSKTFNE